ncbi:MAG: hypothetical protein ACRDT4_22135, partial [Micromonosporaceae bacterium]
MLDTPSFRTTGFDPGNRAYQRFGHMLREHFDVIEWRREANDELVLTTVTDLDTGDSFSFTVIDSVEDQQPCAVLALRDGQLTAHGPVAGIASACRHAPTLALTSQEVTATMGVRLHNPTDKGLPDTDFWYQQPPTDDLAVSPASSEAAP